MIGEYHLPGHNYMGPGTKVVDRLKMGALPTSYGDTLALNHDIDYLQARDGKDTFIADAKAFTLPKDLSSIALSAGMLAKQAIPYSFNQPSLKNRLQAREALSIIKDDSRYLNHYKTYNISVPQDNFKRNWRINT